MSQFQVEDTASDQGPEQPSGPLPVQLARYSLHVPARDNDGKELAHVLGQIRQELTDAGLSGRTVVPKVQGDWQGDESFYETEEMHVIWIDAPDDPQVLQAIIRIAGRVKELAGQEAVYLTVQSIQAYLI